MYSPQRAPLLCAIAASLSLVTAVAPGQTTKTTSPAAPATPWSGNKVVLLASQSVGGVLVKHADKSVGVALEKSCERPWPEVTRFEWTVSPALPVGWWHGIVEFCVREGEDRGYHNANLGVVLRSSEKPIANMLNNFHPGKFDPRKTDAEHFEFWTYISTPAEGVHVQDVYARLYLYKRTWPIRQVTLEHVDPAALTANDSVSLELPVQKDGSVSLPTTLPAGLWCMTAAMRKEGVAICEGDDGRRVEGEFSFDKWRRPSPVRFYLDSPLKKITFKTGEMFKSVVLENSMVRPSESLATDGRLITTVDPAKSQTAQLEMIGANLTGDAPALPSFPGGLRTAVLTTWDDGAPPDLRLAEILQRLGYHPTFFLNQNNPAMKFLDKLEGFHVEVGSHCYHHPFLHILPPRCAMEECVEMRKVLEKELKHPVISFAYPNGYTPAYDPEGDYVLRAVKAAGYWSGRTTAVASETFESIAEPLTMKTNGFFGDRKGLEKAWEETRVTEGGIFAFWGHSWQIGKTDEQWNDFENFAAKFAHQPNTWYASQGDLFLWLWSRKNVRLAVMVKTPTKVTVQLTRPWLHPWLSAHCPLSLKIPAGVEKVMWQGKTIAVDNGFVKLPWVDRPD